MKGFLNDAPGLFEAFIKSVQYSVSLKTQQDIRDHLGKFITTYFPAEWTAFVERDAVNGLSIHHSTLPEVDAAQRILTDEVQSLIVDVLDSGFLASQIILTPVPSMTVFLPIVEESQPTKVMLVGHETADPLPNELLNIYLAIAGLAGTTFERLNSERELNRHRAHLEELVKERTFELQRTNEQLELEITERKAIERALHTERERLSVTLGSIGDGVIATDVDAKVILINEVAQNLTGWTQAEAYGKPLDEVFPIINEKTRVPAINPVPKVLETGLIVGLANHTALIAKDGTEVSIADSCAPIRAKDGSVIGAVLVFRDVTKEKAVQEERERLYEVQRNIADTLQGALLTMPEQIKGLEFGYLYYSATEAAQVGGDFFDLFEIDNNRVGIMLGDVSGKGIKASALTAVVRNTIRAYVFDGYSPAEVMARSNNAVCKVTGFSSFITVFFGILDTHTGRLTFCSAGHPPAIIKRATGSIDLINTDSPMIGAFCDMVYDDAEIVLGRGDALILYTDGIIEARCDGVFYGEEQLVRCIKSLKPTRTAEVPHAILNDVSEHSEGKLLDDIAMLAIALESDVWA